MFGDINAFLESGSNVVIAIPEIGVVANSDIAYDINTGTEIPDRTAFTYLQEANVGAFQVGFFPIMMFGLPAVGLAIASQADKEYRKSAYALLSGVVGAITIATGASFGFGFSAGAIDFGLSVPNSLNLSHGISSYANG